MRYAILGVLFVHLYSIPSLGQSLQRESESVSAYSDEYAEIQSVSINFKGVSEVPALLRSEAMPFIDVPLSSMEAAPAGGGGALEIVQILLKLWQIIEKNQPVVAINTPSARALPKIAEENWMALTGWLPERSVDFEIKAKNLLGFSPITYVYSVRLLAGGGYRGQGHYIARAGVLAKEADVWPGFKLTSTVSVASVQNVGTEDNPVAAITLDLTTALSSKLKHITYGHSFLLRGDGLLKDLDDGKIYFEAKNEIR